MRSIAKFAILAVVGGCGVDNSIANKECAHYDALNTELLIPNVYLLPGLPATITAESGDADEGVSLKIPLSDLKMDSTVDDQLAESTIVLLSPSVEGHSSSTLGPDVLNALRATDVYADRIVEFDQRAQLYRIYPKAGFPQIWQYVRDIPGEQSIPGETWVARCTGVPGNSKPPPKEVTCQSVAFYRSIRIEFSFSGAHVAYADRLANELKNLIGTWDTSRNTPINCKA